MVAIPTFTHDNTSTAVENPLLGWTHEPQGRGTWTLILSSLSTTFLCTWVVIHLRIDRRFRHRILHKIALLIKTIIAPEFIAVEAAQEWTQARRIVRQCSEYTNGEMKLVHAFYIGMLGVRYRVSSASKIQDGSHAKVLWPTQFVWLLQTGHIRWNDLHDWGLAEESINDKSNADSVAKLLALGGVAKFCIDCLLRAYHRLPISALESMTLGYIPLFALSYFFWWLKPKDIDTPSIIDLPSMEIADRREFDELALSDAFDLEGKPHQGRLSGAWCLMPRDFEREVLQQELIDIQHARFGEGRVVSHWDPDLYHSKLWPIACIFGISFGALHLASWDIAFPTVYELWIWRVSAIVSMVAMLVFMQFQKVVLRWADPVTVICMISAGLYLLSRIGAMVEAFSTLRGSDPAIYMTP
jgi:hypothetical protein